MSRSVAIIGSGFSGSILALLLQKSGYSVHLIDRGSHPRFAIGESSTPYADMILRSLARRYDLPVLEKLSRYGTWHQSIPSIEGGSKQGFIYFPHHEISAGKGERWQGELAVASSTGRDSGDSNWIRSTVDHQLYKSCQELNISCHASSTVTSAHRSNGTWTLEIQPSNGSRSELCVDVWVDATGSGTLANRLLGIQERTQGFRTRSSARFTHLDGLLPWETILARHGYRTDHVPFPVDDSALHHLTNSGWIWSLRFDNGRTSIGQLVDLSTHSMPKPPSSLSNWITDSFPTLLQEQLQSATLSPDPGRVIQTGPLQRQLVRASGPGWVALPSTAGFIDPLHSTGLSWSLHGIEWLALTFEHGVPNDSILEDYEKKLALELDAIDLLVSTSYRTRSSSEAFELSTMLYFIATVVSEELRMGSEQKDAGFLSTRNEPLWRAIRSSANELTKAMETDGTANRWDHLFRTFRDRFAPWNRVGLFNRSAEGIYRHTAPNIQDGH